MKKEERERIEKMLGTFHLLLSVVEHDAKSFNKIVAFDGLLKVLKAAKEELKSIYPREVKRGKRAKKATD